MGKKKNTIKNVVEREVNQTLVPRRLFNASFHMLDA